jgi:hypothetical protein
MAETELTILRPPYNALNRPRGKLEHSRQFPHPLALTAQPYYLGITKLVRRQPTIVATSGKRAVKAGGEKVAPLILIFKLL